MSVPVSLWRLAEAIRNSAAVALKKPPWVGFTQVRKQGLHMVKDPSGDTSAQFEKFQDKWRCVRRSKIRGVHAPADRMFWGPIPT